MNDNANTNTIDESLYSRQLYVLGHDAMQNMSKSNILICGMDGLGVEIAKNIILSGVKSVTIMDDASFNLQDFSSNFYLSNEDLILENNKSSKAKAVRSKLAELNMYVDVNIFDGQSMGSSEIEKYDLAILSNHGLPGQIVFNNLCRNSKTKFISARTMGLVGQIFCDFGNTFVVNDTDGEQPLTSIVINIDEQGNLIVSDTTPHGLTNSDQIELVEVVSNVDINNHTFDIKVTSPTSFQILNFPKDVNYISGGIVKQLKFPELIKFAPLSESINDPEFVITDFENFNRPKESHLAFQAIDSFKLKHGVFPSPWNQVDADKFIQVVKDHDSTFEETEFFRKFAMTCQGDIAPMQSVIGSIVAQEAIKACSHKFRPIKQWLYFDSLKSLPSTDLTPEDCLPTYSRYDNQVKVFGNEFQEKLANQNWFVVGSGAIGCELLKNFALIGLATGEGKITITDMDTIEKSNLNRQFLFRSNDIGKPKSESAASAIKKMNPNVNIEAQLNKVCPENENFYSPSFYQNLDGVANALDNVQARLYVDKQCVLHGKPLLESGTLGTKGNTQIIIPGLTESYGSTQDPPEKSIPICTIKNFPNAIEHTIQWAREDFEGLFTRAPQNAEMYLKDKNFINTLSLSDKNTVIQDVMMVLVNDRPETFFDCVKWALNYWYTKYRNDIMQMIEKFPKDCLTSSGVPFWSGGKRCPHPITFDSDNKDHMNYLVAASNLWATVHGIIGSQDLDTLSLLIQEVEIPDFSPNSNCQISVTDEEEKNKTVEEIDENCIPDLSELKDYKLFAQEFEKDDETNFHIDFITASSNMRALNYDIETASKHKTKGIAGKIIPAIATTTSLVAGLVTLELYKVVQGHNKLDQFRSGFINLALPYFGFADPIQSKINKFQGKDYTIWDHIEIREEMTLGQLIDYFEKEYQTDICTLTYGALMLHAFFIPSNNMDKTISQIIQEKTGQPLNKEMVILTVISSEDELDVPQVKYFLNNSTLQANSSSV